MKFSGTKIELIFSVNPTILHKKCFFPLGLSIRTFPVNDFTASYDNRGILFAFLVSAYPKFNSLR